MRTTGNNPTDIGDSAALGVDLNEFQTISNYVDFDTELDEWFGKKASFQLFLTRHKDTYCPTIRNLELLLAKFRTKDSSDLYTKEDLYSLILEASIVTFFTTRCGESILNLLTYLQSSNGSKDTQTTILPQLQALHNWYTVQEQRALNHKYQHECWVQSKERYLLRFLDFILSNRGTSIDINNYNKASYKVPISFLCASSSYAAALVLDDTYNLLLDFCIFFKPYLEYILETARQLSAFKVVIMSYQRAYESSGNYFWYTMDASLSTDLKSRSKYLESDSNQLFPQRNSDMGDTIANNNIRIRFDTTDNDNNNNTNISSSNSNSNSEVSFFEPNDIDEMLQRFDIIENTTRRHRILYKIMQLDTIASPLLEIQFKLIAGLVDPLTQPSPNDKFVISLDLLYRLFIGILIKYYKIDKDQTNLGSDWKFTTCFNMQKIIDHSLLRLNCHDYQTLASLGDVTQQSWKAELHKWLPHGLNTQDLELVYMIDILAVYTIYQLYNYQPIQLNPFLSPLIQLWKNLSCVILLGLEIDRLEEAHGTFETPLLVRATVRGTTALRSVVASILNQHMDVNKHDFRHETLNTFMSPYGRKLCQGALLADLRSFAAALLALGSDLEDITELLADLQPGDRFDEDVRYMFEYECDDYEDSRSISGSDGGSNNGDVAAAKAVGSHVGGSIDVESVDVRATVHRRRCRCIFEDDKLLGHDIYARFDDVGDQNGTTSGGKVNGSATGGDRGNPHDRETYNSRLKSYFEFDYGGKDWRDVPRGFNLYYSPGYKFIRYPRYNLFLLLTERATTRGLSNEESLQLLRLVASAIKLQQENTIYSTISGTSQGVRLRDRDETIRTDEADRVLTPDDIYDIWCRESVLERILYFNQDVSWKLIDEMLMCSGHRRALIWFITHMEINHSLIHYIFELVMNLRGEQLDPDISLQDQRLILLSEITRTTRADTDSHSEGQATATLPFSRQGNIVLSDIETKMLLQEFFTNAAIYFPAVDEVGEDAAHQTQNGDIKKGDAEDSEDVSLYSIGLVKLICYMVQAIVKSGKFDFSKSGCTFELQTLLMNWIGVIPEAHDLLFALKLNVPDDSNVMDQTIGFNSLNEEFTGSPTSSNDNSDITEPVSEYNEKLLSLLPPITKKKESSPAVETLRSFLKRYSLTEKVAIPGRKVLVYDDTILPLAKPERPIKLSPTFGQDGPNSGKNDFYYGSETE